MARRRDRPESQAAAGHLSTAVVIAGLRKVWLRTSTRTKGPDDDQRDYCRWRSKPASIWRRMPTGSLANVGSGGQRGLKRAADVELMLLFRWSASG